MAIARRATAPENNTTSPKDPMAGKVILITGGSAGLGKQAAVEFARREAESAQIWLTGRNIQRLERAAADIRSQVGHAPPIHLLTLDLGSFRSVKEASAEFLRQCPRLHILMLNAGVMSLPAGTTEDGYEVQFGTNHMGHALLFRLLEPALAAARGDACGGPRVVVLSSSSHRDDAPAGGIAWGSLRTAGGDMFTTRRYGQSKLANALFARELARRRPWLRVAAVHPGVVRGTRLQASATGFPPVVRCAVALVRLLFTVSLEEGVRTQIWAAEDAAYTSGGYFEPVGVPGLASPHATDDGLAERLWLWTERELDAHGFSPVAASAEETGQFSS